MKFTTEIVHRVRFYDLQRAIEKLYNVKNIDVLWNRDDFCNGSFYDVTVDGESELDSIDDDERIEEWLANPNPELCMEYALHLLFKAHHIPTGKFLVEIVW